MTVTFSRRRVLVGLSAAILVSGSPLRQILSSGTDTLSTLRSALLEACGSWAIPANLGRACLMQGHSHSLVRKPQELVASYDRARIAGVGFVDWFKMETMSDFDAGRIVRVEGWVIS